MELPKKTKNRKEIPIRRPVRAAPMLVEKIVSEEAADEILENITSEELEDNDKLREFQEQFGGKQYYVRIERYNEETNEAEIVDKIYLDSFDPFVLGKKYGGGKFICTMLNDRGRYMAGGRMHFNFAKPVLDKRDERPTGIDDPAMKMFIESMKSQQTMLMEILKASLTQEKTTDIDKMVSALKGLHDMNPKEKSVSSTAQMKEMLEMMTMLKEVTGGDSDRDEKVSMFSDLKDAFKILMESRKIPTPTNAPMIKSMPIVQKPAANVTVKEEPVFIKPIALEILEPYIPKFVDAARAHEDIETWSEYLFEVIDTKLVPALSKHYSTIFFKVSDDDVWERLLEASEDKDKDKINKIFEFAPALEPHRDWVYHVIEQTIKDITADGDGQSTEGSPVVEIPISENGV